MQQDRGEALAVAASLGINVTALAPQIACEVGFDASIEGVAIVGVDPARDAAKEQLIRGLVITAGKHLPGVNYPELRSAKLSAASHPPVETPVEFTRLVKAAKAAGANSVVLSLLAHGVGADLIVDFAR